MLKEMIFVFFITSLVMSIGFNLAGINEEYRLLFGIFNGLFWFRYFNAKYYSNKNDKKEN